MGGEFGEEWIHVHVWLSPFAASPKTTPVLLNQLYSNKKQKEEEELVIHAVTSSWR